jgi:GntR family transcriptional regulator, transcriptional repressor for pyruvate dehydrogenase complex
VTDLSTSGLTLQPVARSKLAAETVARQLMAGIQSKNLLPGTRMPSERELMAALGVGRSTIREAVNGLAMVGVLEIRPGQGTFVADRTDAAEPPQALAAALARGATHNLFERYDPDPGTDGHAVTLGRRPGPVLHCMAQA